MPRLHVFLSGSAVAAALVSAVPAHAAADDLAPLITVTAQRTTGYVAPQSSTATRTDTPLLDVPQAVSVLTRARLDDQAILTIGDALRYVPGATIGQGEGHRDQMTLRGNNSTADFFVDGLRDDVQYFRDFYNVERLEVLKGPNAMIFGRGGGGGVVNRVSKTPFDQQMIAADAALDTFGAWRVAADINAPLGGGVSARLNGFYEDGANHRDVYDAERYAINPTLGFGLGADGHLILGYEYVRDSRVVDRGVPSQDGRPVTGFRDSFFGNPQVNETDFTAHIGSLAADYSLTDTLTISNRTRFGDFDKAYSNVFIATPVNTTAGTVGIEAYVDAIQRQSLLSQTDLAWKTSTGSIGHTLLAGVEVGRQTSRSQRNNGFFDPVLDTRRISVPFTDPFATPIPAFRLGTGSRSVRTQADILGLYVQDQMTLSDHFEVVAGLRYDRFTLDVDNFISNASFSRTDTLWSPRLGLIYKPVPQASIYLNYSRSYLPQSGDQFLALDASTATLEPERFDNYEIGAKWDITPGFNVTAALYQLDRSNARAAGPVAGTIVLTGEQRSRGLEVELNGKLSERWQMAGGFAVQKAEIRSPTTEGPAGREVPLVPRFQASLWNRYDVTDSIGLGLGINHQGKSFANISNAVILPAYTRFDAAAFIKLAPGIDAQVNIENLFNTAYFPTAHNDNNISTGVPPAARFTLRTQF